MENKDLTITTNEGKEMYVIDSREVAEMMGKTHSYILEMIQGRKGKLGIIPILTNANLAVVDYFIESNYKDVKGEERKCYLCTKMGCEMLGNKQQGEKGILFTAKYVARFNEYEKRLKELPTPSYVIEDPIKRAERWIQEQKEKIKLECTIKEITTHSTTIEDSRMVINSIIKKIGGKNNNFGEAYNEFYRMLNYKLGINIKARDKIKGKSWLDTLNEEETFKAEEIARNWAIKNGLDINSILTLK